MSQNTPSNPACTCDDWKYHGMNLYHQRVCNKIKLAEKLEVTETASKSEMREFTVKSGDNEYYVTVGTGSINSMCKHGLAALWKMGLVPVLVEYEYGAEIRALQPKEEVKRITVLERKQDETDERADGQTEPAF